MDDKVVNGIIAILVAVVGLATTAVIFSTKANTANVITAGGNSFASIIKAAVGPVS
jgi:hypothetical protein